MIRALRTSELAAWWIHRLSHMAAIFLWCHARGGTLKRGAAVFLVASHANVTNLNFTAYWGGDRPAFQDKTHFRGYCWDVNSSWLETLLWWLDSTENKWLETQLDVEDSWLDLSSIQKFHSLSLLFKKVRCVVLGRRFSSEEKDLNWLIHFAWTNQINIMLPISFISLNVFF